MKKILFFSCEPGGAEVLIPVIELLQKNKEFKVIVLGYGHGSKRFAQKGIAHCEIAPIQKEDFDLFEKFKPDCIISSACSLPYRDMSEKYLWYNARQREIPTVAFLDSWQNYSIRFSGTSDFEKLKYMPDFINCINEIGHQEMLAEGFDEIRLLKFGQPYLSSVKQISTEVKVEKLKQVYKLSNDRPVYLFVSEAIQENYSNERGYNQYQVLRYFLQNIYRQVSDAIVVVKLHPKDQVKLFHNIKAEFQNKDVIFLGENIKPIESIMISDYVFGMSSIMLIEAYIIGKSVMSLQPNLIGDDPCVLSKYGYIPITNTYNDFDLKNLPTIHKTVLFNYEFDYEAFLIFLRKKINYEI